MLLSVGENGVFGLAETGFMKYVTIDETANSENHATLYNITLYDTRLRRVGY